MSSQPVNVDLSAATVDPSHLRPPARHLSFPPEVLLQVFSFLPGPHNRRWADFEPHIRNGTLAAACLVSKVWSAVAYSELYSTLDLAWWYLTGSRLVASFTRNPALSARVRSVDSRCMRPGDPYYAAHLAPQLKRVSPAVQSDPWAGAGHEAASSSHWAFVAGLPNLRRISVDSFDCYIPLDLQSKLTRVCSSLRVVAIDCAQATLIIPLLQDVEVLVLGFEVTGEPPPGSDPSHKLATSSPLHLDNLTHLRIAVGEIDAAPGELLPRIFQVIDIGKLVGLEILYDAGDPEFLRLASLIPSLDSLRSFTVFQYDKEDEWIPGALERALEGLKHVRLEHLQLSWWPSPDLLSTLPPTLTSLIVGFDHLPSHGNIKSDVLFTNALEWKKRYFPELRVVGVDSHQLQVADNVAQLDELSAVMGRAEDFEFRLHRNPSYYPGRWDGG